MNAQGISTDINKINLVDKWPVPRNLKEFRSFICLCSYYREYVRDFARTAEPLHALTRKGRRYEWSEECPEAFEQLKRDLHETPTLALPTCRDNFILDTDASETGLGAVLSKMVDGEERPVAFASRLCSAAERNYNVTRRELSAVMFALKTFRQYLLGVKFTIRTDHAALQWLKKTPTPFGQQARWVEQLEEFDYVIQHRPGHQHGNADALSRRPMSGELDSDEPVEDAQFNTRVVKEANLEVSVDDSRTIEQPVRESPGDKQLNDPELREIYALKLGGPIGRTWSRQLPGVVNPWHTYNSGTR